ncbi:MAG: flavodoxin-dependent (E)-4-hydroxy-3-methylbut-2-enyl-diphosphate synthase [Peptoniphilus sp.]|uniref:flavodoxin-dependent (E)-4-hydroxy-3-methylbut-2-enyl-diphosphate synthase n=1 Tax=Peptoniphilus sp. TaxID=1971214 RepID=UPI002A75A30B|nr:flavodoxin-dependent (E)-4-hydroxy-3-methylbut-2-enyl-diphosphate synthase [Peptoniphilus sp.]MDY2987639.1 flavodoxin-dependent (E)-4-hydroxy-3-methylbut-2-enyl-diphosphate synthase [Peptoniphilus sp.]
MINRRQTKQIVVGNVPVGGDAPITVQSMTNTKTKDVQSTVAQILQLENVGCDIIRFAVNDRDDAEAIQKIKKSIHIPVVVDIQFDHRLAVMSAEMGADCIRINPGNIGDKNKVKEVVEVCKHYGLPIRIGVNSGSIHKDLLSEMGGVNANSIVQSAMREIEVLEDLNFFDIKVSLKASNVNLSIDSYSEFSKICDYPLHLGITEAGPAFQGAVKSAVGIGYLLREGIGDTIRVSLTSDPVEEIKVGREILKSLNLLTDGIEIISCPTCARTNIDLLSLVEKAEKQLSPIKKNLKIALMGCAVNGPGEAREADIGIAGGIGEAILFKKGVIVKKISEENLLDELVKEIKNM